MNRLLLTATASVFLLGCRATPTFTDVDRTAVAAEIRAARDAFFDAATTFDANAMVAFLDEDFIHLSNSEIQPIDRNELAQAWTELSHIEMHVHSDRVVALTRDSGYTIRTASYVVFDTAGVVVESSDWAGTHIWVRTDEGWKVQAAHEGRPVR